MCITVMIITEPKFVRGAMMVLSSKSFVSIMRTTVNTGYMQCARQTGKIESWILTWEAIILLHTVITLTSGLGEGMIIANCLIL